MMCCKVSHIKALNKAPGKWCPHAVVGKGCGIYADRPAVCSAFFCEWMRNASLGPEWKPDKAKLVVSYLPNLPFLDIWVDPSVPDAWTKPPYFTQIKQWAVEGPKHGHFVLVRIGPRLIAVLPDREIDLGHVDPGAQIAVSREIGPAGVSYDCRGQTPLRDSNATGATKCLCMRKGKWENRLPGGVTHRLRANWASRACAKRSGDVAALSSAKQCLKIKSAGA